MKSFQYRLESLLEDRKRTETDARKQFSHIAGVFHSHEEELAQRRTRYEEACRRSQDPGRPLTVEDVRNRILYKDYLHNTVEEQKKITEEARRQMEREREKLVQARKNLKVLDKHKEQQYNSFLKERDRQEQGLMDELAVMRFSHRKRG